MNPADEALQDMEIYQQQLEYNEYLDNMERFNDE